QRIGHRGVSDRDALESFGRINQKGLSHHHPQRRRTRRNALGGCRSGRGGGGWGGRIVRTLSRSVLSGRVLSRGRRRCRSGSWVAFWSYGAREDGCGWRTEKQNGCDQRKSFHEFGPRRG